MREQGFNVSRETNQILKIDFLMFHVKQSVLIS